MGKRGCVLDNLARLSRLLQGISADKLRLILRFAEFLAERSK
ncbi:hypothetical protein ES705_35911 [subsurface metagenome]